MKKYHYTVLFASERNDYSKSFRVSRGKLLVLMFFGMMLMILALLGSWRIFNQDELTNELSILKDRNVLFQNLLNDMEFSQVMDSSINYEEFISTYYAKHKVEYPNKPPVKGYVTRGLNIENKHFGIDIAAKYQDDIYSPGNGRVIFSDFSVDLGNTIIINHPGGFITVYGHNDSNLVVSGNNIRRGQIIARVGETGKSKGPHLHFEIWKNYKVLDPRDIIPEYKQKDVSIK